MSQRSLSGNALVLGQYLTWEPPRPPPNAPTVIHRVSSFWAALYDARGAAGRVPETGVVHTPRHSASWLAAIGYLSWFDQVGGSLLLDGKQSGGRSVRGALRRFSNLGTDEIDALYALRCSLAHDYSLINPRSASPKDPGLWHCFMLDDGPSPIRIPPQRWDGVTFPPTAQTFVGLRGVGDLAEEVKDRILERWTEGRLGIACPPDEMGPRFFFTYFA